MSAPCLIRWLSALAATAGVAYWLFGDTVRHYRADGAAGPLRVSFWGGYEEYKMWKEMLVSFRQAHPEIPVKAEYITDRYEAKIRQLLVADAAPDVMLFQDEPFPNFVDSGKFEDITPWLTTPGRRIDPREFWDTSVEVFGRHEGAGEARSWRMYGVPIWGGCNLILYNRECFRNAGVRVESLPGPAGLVRDPQAGGWILDDERWTIDEFVRLCRMLTVDEDGDGRTDQFGFHLPGFIYWLPWHWSLGARVLDPSRQRTTLYGPESEASLRLWQDLRYTHRVSPTPAELSTMGESAGLFTGRVAMLCSGPWSMPFHNHAGLDYDVLHVPRGSPGGTRATRVTWDSLVMFKGSRNKQHAWTLIHHLAGPRCQRIVARYQRSVPARRSVRDDFCKLNPRVSVGKFIDAADSYARVQPITRHWNIMIRELNRAGENLLHPDPRHRYSAGEAIGQFLAADEVMEVLPPASPDEAERYRRIFRRREGRR